MKRDRSRRIAEQVRGGIEPRFDAADITVSEREIDAFRSALGLLSRSDAAPLLFLPATLFDRLSRPWQHVVDAAGAIQGYVQVGLRASVTRSVLPGATLRVVPRISALRQHGGLARVDLMLSVRDVAAHAAVGEYELSAVLRIADGVRLRETIPPCSPGAGTGLVPASGRPLTPMTHRALGVPALLQYAKITNDWNPVHFDDASAADARLGRAAVPGMAILSVVIDDIEGQLSNASRTNTTSLNARFVRPTHTGDSLRTTGRGRADTRAYRFVTATSDGTEIVRGTLTLEDALIGSAIGDGGRKMGFGEA